MQKIKERKTEFLVNENGLPKAVVLDMQTYKNLLQIAEEKEDIKEFERLKNEKAVPFDKFEQELKRNGLL